MLHSADTNQSTDHDSRQSSIFEPPEYRIFYGPDNTLHWDPPVGSPELAIALSYYFPLENDLANKMRAATKDFLKSQAKRQYKRGETKSISQEQVLPSSVTPQISRSLPTERSLSSHQNSPQSIAPGQAGTRFDSQRVSNYNPTCTQVLNEKKTYPLNAAQTDREDLLGIRLFPQVKEIDTTMDLFQILSWSPESCRRKKRPYEKFEKVQVAANRGHVCEAHRRRKAKCDPDRCPDNGQNRKVVASPPEKRQRSMPEPPSKTTPSSSYNSVKRNWAPQELVYPSISSGPKSSLDPSSQPTASSSNSSALGAPWGPRNSSLFHTLYSPIWYLHWGYDDGQSGLCHIFQNEKLHRNAKERQGAWARYYNAT